METETFTITFCPNDEDRYEVTFDVTERESVLLEWWFLVNGMRTA